jgi:hypothetical protein
LPLASFFSASALATVAPPGMDSIGFWKMHTSMFG